MRAIRSENNTGSTDGTGRSAVILAGGEGTRLRKLTRMISGDNRPKQFCSIVGGETLLDQTRRRVAPAVPPNQTFVVVTEHHRQYYQPLLFGVARERVIAQPFNRGTAPAIIYSLMRVAAMDPQISVAFFPSDHYFSDDAEFMDHVETAFEAVRLRQDLIILLGITPTGPEVEYGWIEPSSPIRLPSTDVLSRVRRFWEKPTHHHASLLFAQGCLWNSFVMVGRAQEFLSLIRRTLPEMYFAFEAIRPTFGTASEKELVRGLYMHLASSNFSHEVLAACPDFLAVLPVKVEWSDWGDPERVFSTLASRNLQADWLTEAACP
jgi:mannose-1-phosphate guanylyltransferase